MGTTNESDTGDLVVDVADAAMSVAAGAAELVGDAFIGATDVIEAAISPRRTVFTRALAMLITLSLIGAAVAYWRKRSTGSGPDSKPKTS